MYHYAGNNPVRYVDPTGLEDEIVIPTYFNQNQWTKAEGFSKKFYETACAATATLNAVSFQYTIETGEALSFEEGKNMMFAAIEIDAVDIEDATVNNWQNAANSMGLYIGLNGEFIVNEISPTLKIYAFTNPSEDFSVPVHFSFVTNQVTQVFIDSWDGIEKGWSVDGFCGGIPNIPYRTCPLQTGRPYRGFDYIQKKAE